MSWADKFNLLNPIVDLRLICALFFIPHIVGKFTEPATLGFFKAAKFNPPATWMYIAGTSETFLTIGLVCDLFALSTIEADRAWFMEHGRLTVQRSKAITREVNDLCRLIRPIAVDLVDAWGVPPEMLRAPELVG